MKQPDPDKGKKKKTSLLKAVQGGKATRFFNFRRKSDPGVPPPPLEELAVQEGNESSKLSSLTDRDGLNRQASMAVRSDQSSFKSNVGGRAQPPPQDPTKIPVVRATSPLIVVQDKSPRPLSPPATLQPPGPFKYGKAAALKARHFSPARTRSPGKKAPIGEPIATKDQRLFDKAASLPQPIPGRNPANKDRSASTGRAPRPPVKEMDFDGGIKLSAPSPFTLDRVPIQGLQEHTTPSTDVLQQRKLQKDSQKQSAAVASTLDTEAVLALASSGLAIQEASVKPGMDPHAEYVENASTIESLGASRSHKSEQGNEYKVESADNKDSVAASSADNLRSKNSYRLDIVSRASAPEAEIILRNKSSSKASRGLQPSGSTEEVKRVKSSDPDGAAANEFSNSRGNSSYTDESETMYEDLKIQSIIHVLRSDDMAMSSSISGLTSHAENQAKIFSSNDSNNVEIEDCSPRADNGEALCDTGSVYNIQSADYNFSLGNNDNNDNIASINEGVKSRDSISIGSVSSKLLQQRSNISKEDDCFSESASNTLSLPMSDVGSGIPSSNEHSQCSTVSPNALIKSSSRSSNDILAYPDYKNSNNNNNNNMCQVSIKSQAASAIETRVVAVDPPVVEDVVSTDDDTTSSHTKSSNSTSTTSGIIEMFKDGYVNNEDMASLQSESVDFKDDMNNAVSLSLLLPSQLTAYATKVRTFSPKTHDSISEENQSIYTSGISVAQKSVHNSANLSTIGDIGRTEDAAAHDVRVAAPEPPAPAANSLNSCDPTGQTLSSGESQNSDEPELSLQSTLSSNSSVCAKNSAGRNSLLPNQQSSNVVDSVNVEAGSPTSPSSLNYTNSYTVAKPSALLDLQSENHFDGNENATEASLMLDISGSAFRAVESHDTTVLRTHSTLPRMGSAQGDSNYIQAEKMIPEADLTQLVANSFSGSNHSRAEKASTDGAQDVAVDRVPTSSYGNNNTSDNISYRSKPKSLKSHPSLKSIISTSSSSKSRKTRSVTISEEVSVSKGSGNVEIQPLRSHDGSIISKTKEKILAKNRRHRKKRDQKSKEDHLRKSRSEELHKEMSTPKISNTRSMRSEARTMEKQETEKFTFVPNLTADNRFVSPDALSPTRVNSPPTLSKRINSTPVEPPTSPVLHRTPVDAPDSVEPEHIEFDSSIEPTIFDKVSDSNVATPHNNCIDLEHEEPPSLIDSIRRYSLASDKASQVEDNNNSHDNDDKATKKTRNPFDSDYETDGSGSGIENMRFDIDSSASSFTDSSASKPNTNSSSDQTSIESTQMVDNYRETVKPKYSKSGSSDSYDALIIDKRTELHQSSHNINIEDVQSETYSGESMSYDNNNENGALSYYEAEYESGGDASLIETESSSNSRNDYSERSSERYNHFTPIIDAESEIMITRSMHNRASFDRRSAVIDLTSFEDEIEQTYSEYYANIGSNPSQAEALSENSYYEPIVLTSLKNEETMHYGNPIVAHMREQDDEARSFSDQWPANTNKVDKLTALVQASNRASAFIDAQLREPLNEVDKTKILALQRISTAITQESSTYQLSSSATSQGQQANVVLPPRVYHINEIVYRAELDENTERLSKEHSQSLPNNGRLPTLQENKIQERRDDELSLNNEAYIGALNAANKVSAVDSMKMLSIAQEENIYKKLSSRSLEDMTFSEEGQSIEKLNSVPTTLPSDSNHSFDLVPVNASTSIPDLHDMDNTALTNSVSSQFNSQSISQTNSQLDSQSDLQSVSKSNLQSVSQMNSLSKSQSSIQSNCQIGELGNNINTQTNSYCSNIGEAPLMTPVEVVKFRDNKQESSTVSDEISESFSEDGIPAPLVDNVKTTNTRKETIDDQKYPLITKQATPLQETDILNMQNFNSPPKKIKPLTLRDAKRMARLAIDRAKASNNTVGSQQKAAGLVIYPKEISALPTEQVSDLDQSSIFQLSQLFDEDDENVATESRNSQEPPSPESDCSRSIDRYAAAITHACSDDSDAIDAHDSERNRYTICTESEDADEGFDRYQTLHSRDEDYDDNTDDGDVYGIRRDIPELRMQDGNTVSTLHDDSYREYFRTANSIDPYIVFTHSGGALADSLTDGFSIDRGALNDAESLEIQLSMPLCTPSHVVAEKQTSALTDIEKKLNNFDKTQSNEPFCAPIKMPTDNCLLFGFSSFQQDDSSTARSQSKFPKSLRIQGKEQKPSSDAKALSPRVSDNLSSLQKFQYFIASKFVQSNAKEASQADTATIIPQNEEVTMRRQPSADTSPKPIVKAIAAIAKGTVPTTATMLAKSQNHTGVVEDENGVEVMLDPVIPTQKLYNSTPRISNSANINMHHRIKRVDSSIYKPSSSLYSIASQEEFQAYEVEKQESNDPTERYAVCTNDSASCASSPKPDPEQMICIDSSPRSNALDRYGVLESTPTASEVVLSDPFLSESQSSGEDHGSSFVSSPDHSDQTSNASVDENDSHSSNDVPKKATSTYSEQEWNESIYTDGVDSFDSADLRYNLSGELLSATAKTAALHSHGSLSLSKSSSCSSAAINFSPKNFAFNFSSFDESSAISIVNSISDTKARLSTAVHNEKAKKPNISKPEAQVAGKKGKKNVSSTRDETNLKRDEKELTVEVAKLKRLRKSEERKEKGMLTESKGLKSKEPRANDPNTKMPKGVAEAGETNEPEVKLEESEGVPDLMEKEIVAAKPGNERLVDTADVAVGRSEDEFSVVDNKSSSNSFGEVEKESIAADKFAADDADGHMTKSTVDNAATDEEVSKRTTDFEAVHEIPMKNVNLIEQHKEPILDVSKERDGDTNASPSPIDLTPYLSFAESRDDDSLYNFDITGESLPPWNEAAVNNAIINKLDLMDFFSGSISLGSCKSATPNHAGKVHMTAVENVIAFANQLLQKGSITADDLESLKSRSSTLIARSLSINSGNSGSVTRCTQSEDCDASVLTDTVPKATSVCDVTISASKSIQVDEQCSVTSTVASPQADNQQVTTLTKSLSMKEGVRTEADTTLKQNETLVENNASSSTPLNPIEELQTSRTDPTVRTTKDIEKVCSPLADHVVKADQVPSVSLQCATSAELQKTTKEWNEVETDIILENDKSGMGSSCGLIEEKVSTTSSSSTGSSVNVIETAANTSFHEADAVVVVEGGDVPTKSTAGQHIRCKSDSICITLSSCVPSNFATNFDVTDEDERKVSLGADTADAKKSSEIIVLDTSWNIMPEYISDDGWRKESMEYSNIGCDKLLDWYNNKLDKVDATYDSGSAIIWYQSFASLGSSQSCNYSNKVKDASLEHPAKESDPGNKMSTHSTFQNINNDGRIIVSYTMPTDSNFSRESSALDAMKVIKESIDGFEIANLTNTTSEDIIDKTAWVNLANFSSGGSSSVEEIVILGSDLCNNSESTKINKDLSESVHELSTHTLHTTKEAKLGSDESSDSTNSVEDGGCIELPKGTSGAQSNVTGSLMSNTVSKSLSANKEIDLNTPLHVTTLTDDNDILDYIFENVQNYMCRDDSSKAQLAEAIIKVSQSSLTSELPKKDILDAIFEDALCGPIEIDPRAKPVQIEDSSAVLTKEVQNKDLLDTIFEDALCGPIEADAEHSLPQTSKDLLDTIFDDTLCGPIEANEKSTPAQIEDSSAVHMKDLPSKDLLDTLFEDTLCGPIEVDAKATPVQIESKVQHEVSKQPTQISQVDAFGSGMLAHKIHGQSEITDHKRTKPSPDVLSVSKYQVYKSRLSQVNTSEGSNFLDLATNLTETKRGVISGEAVSPIEQIQMHFPFVNDNAAPDPVISVGTNHSVEFEVNNRTEYNTKKSEDKLAKTVAKPTPERMLVQRDFDRCSKGLESRQPSCDDKILQTRSYNNTAPTPEKLQRINTRTYDDSKSGKIKCANIENAETDIGALLGTIKSKSTSSSTSGSEKTGSEKTKSKINRVVPEVYRKRLAQLKAKSTSLQTPSMSASGNDAAACKSDVDEGKYSFSSPCMPQKVPSVEAENKIVEQDSAVTNNTFAESSYDRVTNESSTSKANSVNKSINIYSSSISDKIVAAETKSTHTEADLLANFDSSSLSNLLIPDYQLQNSDNPDTKINYSDKQNDTYTESNADVLQFVKTFENGEITGDSSSGVSVALMVPFATDDVLSITATNGNTSDNDIAVDKKSRENDLVIIGTQVEYVQPHIVDEIPKITAETKVETISTHSNRPDILDKICEKTEKFVCGGTKAKSVSSHHQALPPPEPSVANERTIKAGNQKTYVQERPDFHPHQFSHLSHLQIGNYRQGYALQHIDLQSRYNHRTVPDKAIPVVQAISLSFSEGQDAHIDTAGSRSSVISQGIVDCDIPTIIEKRSMSVGRLELPPPSDATLGKSIGVLRKSRSFPPHYITHHTSMDALKKLTTEPEAFKKVKGEKGKKSNSSVSSPLNQPDEKESLKLTISPMLNREDTTPYAARNSVSTPDKASSTTSLTVDETIDTGSKEEVKSSDSGGDPSKTNDSVKQDEASSQSAELSKIEPVEVAEKIQHIYNFDSSGHGKHKRTITIKTTSSSSSIEYAHEQAEQIEQNHCNSSGATVSEDHRARQFSPSVKYNDSLETTKSVIGDDASTLEHTLSAYESLKDEHSSLKSSEAYTSSYLKEFDSKITARKTVEKPSDEDSYDTTIQPDDVDTNHFDDSKRESNTWQILSCRNDDSVSTPYTGPHKFKEPQKYRFEATDSQSLLTTSEKSYQGLNHNKNSKDSMALCQTKNAQFLPRKLKSKLCGDIRALWEQQTGQDCNDTLNNLCVPSDVPNNLGVVGEASNLLYKAAIVYGCLKPSKISKNEVLIQFSNAKTFIPPETRTATGFPQKHNNSDGDDNQSLFDGKMSVQDGANRPKKITRIFSNTGASGSVESSNGSATTPVKKKQSHRHVRSNKDEEKLQNANRRDLSLARKNAIINTTSSCDSNSTSSAPKHGTQSQFDRVSHLQKVLKGSRNDHYPKRVHAPADPPAKVNINTRSPLSSYQKPSLAENKMLYPLSPTGASVRTPESATSASIDHRQRSNSLCLSPGSSKDFRVNTANKRNCNAAHTSVVSEDNASLILALTRSDGDSITTHSILYSDNTRQNTPHINPLLWDEIVDDSNSDRSKKEKDKTRNRYKHHVNNKSHKSDDNVGNANKKDMNNPMIETLEIVSKNSNASCRGLSHSYSSSTDGESSILSIPQSVHVHNQATSGTTTSTSANSATKIQEILTRLKDRKGKQELRRNPSYDAVPIDAEELFSKYDSIVKDMVILDEGRLQRVYQSRPVDLQYVTSRRYGNNSLVTSTLSSDADRKKQLEALRQRDNSLLLSSCDSSSVCTAKSDKLLPKSSASVSSITSNTPSEKARTLRKQLDDALKASAEIRNKHLQLGEELTTFKSRLQWQRSPSAHGMSQESPRSNNTAEAIIGTPLTYSLSYDVADLSSLRKPFTSTEPIRAISTSSFPSPSSSGAPTPAAVAVATASAALKKQYTKPTLKTLIVSPQPTINSFWNSSDQNSSPASRPDPGNQALRPPRIYNNLSFASSAAESPARPGGCLDVAQSWLADARYHQHIHRAIEYNNARTSDYSPRETESCLSRDETAWSVENSILQNSSRNNNNNNSYDDRHRQSNMWQQNHRETVAIAEEEDDSRDYNTDDDDTSNSIRKQQLNSILTELNKADTTRMPRALAPPRDGNRFAVPALLDSTSSPHSNKLI